MIQDAMAFAGYCYANVYTDMYHEASTHHLPLKSEPEMASTTSQGRASLAAGAPSPPAGRASRDPQPGQCKLLWHAPNASMHEPSSSAAGEMNPQI